VDQPESGAIDWAAVQDAYGTAEAVPGLLARVAAHPSDSDVWNDLWSRLCHQGTVYKASFLSIPTLAAMARSAPATAYSDPLNLLACIAGSTDVHKTRDTRERYAAELASCLPAAEAYAAAAADDADFCYALSVVAGLRGERPWHQALTSIADGEAPGTCPGCGEELCLHIDATPPRVSLSWDEPLDGNVIVPVDPSTIRGIAADLLLLATRHCRTNVTTRLLTILGEGICPTCGTGFSRGKVMGIATDKAKHP